MYIYEVIIIIDLVPQTEYFQTMEVAFEYIQAMIDQEESVNKVIIKPHFVQD